MGKAGPYLADSEQIAIECLTCVGHASIVSANKVNKT